MTEDAKAFIAHLLVADEAERPRAADALSHPWLAPRDRLERQRLHRKTSYDRRKLESFIAMSRWTTQEEEEDDDEDNDLVNEQS